MTLKKLSLIPGINQENTRYTNENGWWVCDKIRFRQGTPEKIGGYTRLSTNSYLGVGRALLAWSTLSGIPLIGLGTNEKYYIVNGGAYNDVTPFRTTSATATLVNPIDTTSGSTVVVINDTDHGMQTGDLVYISGASSVDGIPASELNTRHVVTRINANSYSITTPSAATATVTGGGGTLTTTNIVYGVSLTNPFTTTINTPTVVVDDVGHGAVDGDYVVFSGATAVGGLTITGEYKLTFISENQYSINASSNATSSATGGGTVIAKYELNIGAEIQTVTSGWGSGGWGAGTWGYGTQGSLPMRLWTHSNFGEDLIFAQRGGAIYYWDASTGLTSSDRGVAVASLPGASDVPIVVNSVRVSDASRFVFAFGCNELGSSELDPMLIRWSDQEDATMWTPSATNQAGGIRLSIGSAIVTSVQTRQEIVVWTGSALYSLQYQGPPFIWGTQLLADNISIISPNAVAVANSTIFWMGIGKFYVYNGTAQNLKCDLRQYIFNDLNKLHAEQIFSGTVEEFNEVWWFYPGADSNIPNKYVVYNYAEDIWYMGSMTRYAWLDSDILPHPIACGDHTIVEHESGIDDDTTDETLPVAAYIESAEFDIEDGDRFAFIYRVLPDVTFRGSTADTPSVTMTLYPMTNSGSGFGNSVGGVNNADVSRAVVLPVEEFTGQIYTRVRGRQMVVRIESNEVGVQWQLGSPRIDIRPDGRRA